MNAAITRSERAQLRVRLVAPRPEDEAEFIEAMSASRHLHHPWVTAPCSPAAWRRYLQRLEREDEAGFLVRRRVDGALCGVVNLNVITYEALCSAYVSYYAAAATTGMGYMKEGLRLVAEKAFGSLGLHRLEANIQPGNEASVRLVESVGFECEGYSPRLLHINGKWRDHERWALLSD